MRVIAPLSFSAVRLAASGFALLLGLSLTGCDQVQDMMGEGEATDAAPASSPATTPGTTTPAQQTGQATPAQPAPPNAEQILTEFRALNSISITDEALKRVADVPEAAAEIKDLDLSGAPIGTGGLTLLGRFPNLKTVNLSNIKLPAGGFAGFSPQSTMTEIDLENTTIDAAGVKSLSGIKSLQRINLSRAKAVNMAGLTPLSQMPHLTDLNIGGNPAIDSNVSRLLASMPLVKLNLAQTFFSDDGLADIAGIQSLRELNLSYSRVTGPGFRSAFKSSRLQRLKVGETDFGEDGLMVVRNMKDLEVLNVYKCGIRPVNIAAIKTAFAALPKLRVLNMGVNHVVDPAIGPWFGNCRNLQESGGAEYFRSQIDGDQCRPGRSHQASQSEAPELC